VDFQGIPIEWVWTPLQVFKGGQTRTEAPSTSFGHSTCTASKAAGKIYGSNKDTNLVVVKMPDYSEVSIAEVLWTIHDHVAANRRGSSSVVTVSWGSIRNV